MTENDSHSRRRFLLASSAGLTAITAGCSGVLDEQGSSATGEGSESGSDDDPELPPQIPEEEPNAEDWGIVENGQLTVPPFFDVYQVYSKKPGKDGNINIAMNAMASPFEDYTISVYYTPLDEHENEWNLKHVRNTLIGGGVSGYDSDAEMWFQEEDPGWGRIFERQVSEHGERIASINIPTEASGTISEDFTHPGYRSDGEYTMAEIATADYGEPAQQWSAEKLSEELPDIGEVYHPAYDTDGFLGTADYMNIDVVGSYTMWPNPGTMHPYIYEVEHDFEIPYNKPYVLTFGIEDLEQGPDIDPSKVITQTPQTYNLEEDNGIRTVNRLPLDSPAEIEQNRWKETRHVPDEMVTGGDDEFVIPETKQLDEETQSRGPPHPNKIVEETDGRRKIRSTRRTNFSRFSPEPDRIEEMGLNSDAPSTNIGDNAFDNPRTSFDPTIQNLWSVEYEVTEADVEDGQRAPGVGGMSGEPEPYERLVKHTVEHSEILAGIAENIAQVADNMSLTHPADRILLVSKFVQHIPHVTALTDGDRTGTDGIFHPHWTLFNRRGDCQDFTALANAILAQDPFNVDITPAFTDAMAGIFGNIAGHVSTAVAMDDLGISSFEEDARMYNPDVWINEGLTLQKNGKEYVYIEMSNTGWMMGRANDRWGDFDLKEQL